MAAEATAVALPAAAANVAGLPFGCIDRCIPTGPDCITPTGADTTAAVLAFPAAAIADAASADVAAAADLTVPPSLCISPCKPTLARPMAADTGPDAAAVNGG